MIYFLLFLRVVNLCTVDRSLGIDTDRQEVIFLVHSAISRGGGRAFQLSPLLSIGPMQGGGGNSLSLGRGRATLGRFVLPPTLLWALKYLTRGHQLRFYSLASFLFKKPNYPCSHCMHSPRK